MIDSWAAKLWMFRSSLHSLSKNDQTYLTHLPGTWIFFNKVWLACLFYRPFGQCYEFLTLQTVKKYFLPIIEMVPQFLENLTDEELKKEAKNEAKNDALSMIIKSLKNLASRVPGQEETVKNLEIFRLKMILRWAEHQLKLVLRYYAAR